MPENYIRHFRQEALLTQAGLAHRAGLSTEMVRSIEVGRRPGGWRSRKLIARALDVPEHVLFPHYELPPAPPAELLRAA